MTDHEHRRSRPLRDLLSLEGRTSLVTGGAGFLGRAISETLLELGSDVILASRDLARCEAACATLEKAALGSGRAHALELDVTDPGSVARCFDTVDERWGGLDVLVNNAWSGRKNSFESISESDWAYDLDVSLTSVFRCTRAALEGLKRGRGVVLNISSMYGHVAPAPSLYEGTDYTNPPSYGAAKAGTIQFTRYLATFLAEYGIRVNCISPGPFPHPETRKDREFVARLEARNPLGRLGDPVDLKGAVALLCTDASAYITGQNLQVDGGWAVW